MAFFTLTKKADYGLVLMSELAKAGEGVVVSTQMLSKTKHLPKPFLAGIGKDLVGAEIIGSKEGKNGGYFLKGEPENVKILDVIEAIEGKVKPVACVIEDHNCPVEEVCHQKKFMTRLALEITQMLDQYTVSDLIKS